MYAQAPETHRAVSHGPLGAQTMGVPLMQLWAASHVSLVQGFPSSHAAPAAAYQGTHRPLLQRQPTMQWLGSGCGSRSGSHESSAIAGETSARSWKPLQTQVPNTLTSNAAANDLPMTRMVTPQCGSLAAWTPPGGWR